MKKVALWLGISMMLVACGPKRETGFKTEKATTEASAEEIAEWIAAGDEAWAGRGEEASLKSALEAWEKALKADPSSVETLTKLSRGYYLLADGYTTDLEQKISLHDKGAKYGERAFYLDEDFKKAVDGGTEYEDAVAQLGEPYIGALYWTASNLGRYGVAKGLLNNLFLLPRVKAMQARVMKLDENYFYGGPHRFFGAFYAKAPGFAGGDMAKSVEHFEKAIEIEPNYFGTRVLYAEFYAAKAGDKKLFTEQLNYVKNGSVDSLPDLVPEQTMEKAKAEKLLSEESKLFN